MPRKRKKDRPAPRRVELAGGRYLSYLEQAPDHGQPELAIFNRGPGGRKSAVIATGPAAREAWEKELWREPGVLARWEGLLEEPLYGKEAP